MRRFAFVLCCIVVAGCSRSGGVPAIPAFSSGAAVTRHAASSTVNVPGMPLFAFPSPIDGLQAGLHPAGGLVVLNNDLLGLASAGGSGRMGTVYASRGSTALAAITFVKSNGGVPAGELTLGEGATPALYGTASLGGGSFACKSCGAVYEVQASGSGYQQTVLHSFNGGGDGETPQAGLLASNGTLYGTTAGGGASGNGTVFNVVYPSGATTIPHAFAGGTDGAHPLASLIAVGTTIYGTTSQGGGATACSGGCGTVFSLTGSVERVVHAFTGGSDGADPVAAVAAQGGTLYGTTRNGGGGACTGGCGTVFRIDAHGVEHVLHAFGGKDGANPVSPLLVLGGAVYGTTFNGGAYGAGTVFSVDVASGNETVLHSFGGPTIDGLLPDGAKPSGALLQRSGMLLGTTYGGGGSYLCDGGCGTAFAMLDPSQAPTNKQLPPGGGDLTFGSPRGEIQGSLGVASSNTGKNATMRISLGIVAVGTQAPYGALQSFFMGFEANANPASVTFGANAAKLKLTSKTFVASDRYDFYAFKGPRVIEKIANVAPVNGAIEVASPLQKVTMISNQPYAVWCALVVVKSTSL